MIIAVNPEKVKREALETITSTERCVMTEERAFEVREVDRYQNRLSLSKYASSECVRLQGKMVVVADRYSMELVFESLMNGLTSCSQTR